MITMEEMLTMLDEIATEFPDEFYRKLNGGVILLPEAKLHERNKNNDLFILGEYNFNGTLGRYITIYYGSFERVYGHLTAPQIKEQLKKTLKHEFRHHFESMAGEKGLEIKDAQDLNEYLNRN
jgi:hypothetical protein